MPLCEPFSPLGAPSAAGERVRKRDRARKSGVFDHGLYLLRLHQPFLRSTVLQLLCVAVLSGMADIIAQSYEGSAFHELDAPRTLRFVCFRSVFATPIYIVCILVPTTRARIACATHLRSRAPLIRCSCGSRTSIAGSAESSALAERCDQC